MCSCYKFKGTYAKCHQNVTGLDLYGPITGEWLGSYLEGKEIDHEPHTLGRIRPTPGQTHKSSKA